MTRVGFDFFHGETAPFFVAGTEVDVAAVVGYELFGECESDAAVGAGDEYAGFGCVLGEGAGGGDGHGCGEEEGNGSGEGCRRLHFHREKYHSWFFVSFVRSRSSDVSCGIK